MNCPHCGQRILANDAKCRGCGRHLSQARAAAALLTPVPNATTEALEEGATGVLPGSVTGALEDGATELPPPEDHSDVSPGPWADQSDAAGATRVDSVPPQQDADVTRLGPDVAPAPAPQRTASATSGPRTERLPRAASLPPGSLEIGQAFGSRYHIIKILGLGGMGAVYQAWDAELGVAVALKVIRPEIAANPEAAYDLERRFKRELLLARQVTHKNVVRIHDLGEIDGIKYITMPFVDGEDLATVLQREGEFQVPRVLRIVRPVVAGLVAAHEAGVVHRDLKPANIMIDTDDEALIMDFGIARSAGGPGGDAAPRASVRLTDLQRSAAANATTAGAVVGTVHYMAPEQARGLPVDQRADIYSLGLIVYDMLLGPRRTASAQNVIAELQARMQTAPPSPRSIDPRIPEPLDQIVSRCIEPDPANRFQTTAELALALDRLDELGELKPLPRRFTPRIIAAAAAILVALLGGTWWLARTPPPAAEHAPMSVLVADFKNDTGDPLFDNAVEQALMLGIEGTSFIRAYPRAEAQKIAKLLEQPAGITEESARLIAKREDIKVILAGSIASDGSGYRLSLRAIDPAAEQQPQAELARVTARASAKGDVLPAVATLASRIRKELGDTASETDERRSAADSFTTSSLEALKSYAVAQEFQATGRKIEAMDAFKRAIDLDPKFGLAYSGAAVMANDLGRTEDADAFWKKMLTVLDRMSERERYRALGTYYLGSVRNYQQAIDNYKRLVEAYPADRYGRSNLALAYFWNLEMPKALEEGRRAAVLDPKNLRIHNNYALYAMYAGQFDLAAKESKAVLDQEPNYYLAYVPRAMADLARGDSAAAHTSYEAMAKTGAPGASLANIGLADIALYEGRDKDAVTLLTTGIAADEQAQNTGGLRAKYVMLAEAYEHLGSVPAAVAAANKALEIGGGRVEAQAPAAAVLLWAGQDRTARTIAAALSQRLQPQERAHARILEGRIALKQKRLADAVQAFTEAKGFANLWAARFQLGVAFVEAGHYAEGLAELAECLKRRGESTAIFLNEVPTFRYLAPLPYWMARAQQELGMKDAATASYKTFLAIRSTAANDPLVRDAVKRMNR